MPAGMTSYDAEWRPSLEWAWRCFPPSPLAGEGRGEGGNRWRFRPVTCTLNIYEGCAGESAKAPVFLSRRLPPYLIPSSSPPSRAALPRKLKHAATLSSSPVAAAFGLRGRERRGPSLPQPAHYISLTHYELRTTNQTKRGRRREETAAVLALCRRSGHAFAGRAPFYWNVYVSRAMTRRPISGTSTYSRWRLSKTFWAVTSMRRPGAWRPKS